MRFTVWLFGAEVFAVQIGPGEDDDEEPARAGLLESTPVGFVASYERPDEAELPDRW